MNSDCNCRSHRKEVDRIRRCLERQERFNRQTARANKNLDELVTERETKIAQYETDINEMRDKIAKLEREIGTPIPSRPSRLLYSF